MGIRDISLISESKFLAVTSIKNKNKNKILPHTKEQQSSMVSNERIIERLAYQHDEKSVSFGV